MGRWQVDQRRDGRQYRSRCYWLARVGLEMNNDPVSLDGHRGMAAQKATEARRLLAEVAENDRHIRERLDELERQLSAAASVTWADAAAKATYLLELFATTPQAQDPRRQRLIASALDDFARLIKSVG
jgi:hypothetical protein